MDFYCNQICLYAIPTFCIPIKPFYPSASTYHVNDVGCYDSPKSRQSRADAHHGVSDGGGEEFGWPEVDDAEGGGHSKLAEHVKGNEDSGEVFFSHFCNRKMTRG